MNKMPCKCAGLRVDRCKCKVLRTGYNCDESGSVVLLTHSNSLCRLLDLKEKSPKPNMFVRLIENIYETCAGYNLRYCPIRGFLKHENHLSNTLKDVMILMCFLIANFIVFVAILTKTMVHLYFVIMLVVQWIRRSFITKLDSNEEMISMTPMRFNQDYIPTMSHKIL